MFFSFDGCSAARDHSRKKTGVCSMRSGIGLSALMPKLIDSTQLGMLLSKRKSFPTWDLIVQAVSNWRRRSQSSRVELTASESDTRANWSYDILWEAFLMHYYLGSKYDKVCICYAARQDYLCIIVYIDPYMRPTWIRHNTWISFAKRFSNDQPQLHLPRRTVVIWSHNE